TSQFTKCVKCRRTNAYTCPAILSCIVSTGIRQACEKKALTRCGDQDGLDGDVDLNVVDPR
ncbi:MAG TPA: hypothetical protein VGQ83_04565, partial [Polyangia bacterium]